MTGQGGAADPTGIRLHASCVVLGEAGVLIRGRAGAGKSTLARELVRLGGEAGLFSRHVADDVVALSARAGRLVARPVEAIAGRLEIRGIGLVPVPFAPACLVSLVVDLVAAEAGPRLPEPEALRTVLLNVPLPRLPLPREVAAGIILWRLRGRDDTVVTA